MAFLKRSVSFTFASLFLVLFFLQSSNGYSSPFGFVQTRGPEFVLNGRPFFFNGFNSYWLMTVAADPSQRYKITNVFREASAAGLTVCRTWAFSDGGDQALQISPGVYNERVFQALDFVVHEARKHGIRLILTLTNNWNDFGGRHQYVAWAKNASVKVDDEDDFYTNAVIKGYYKKHVWRVLSRINTITRVAYRDDPTIMAWELMNEPRCLVDTSGKTVNAWVQEMAFYVKLLDRKHLLSVGMEGFYGASIPNRKENNPFGFEQGTDFITNHLVRQIDFSTIHAYPDAWLNGHNDTEQITFMKKWLFSHWFDSKNILRKPLIFSEFGKSKKDQGYSINVRNTYLNAVYQSIYDLAKAKVGGIGGGLIWQIFPEGMESFYDGFEIVLSQDNSTAGIISQHSRKMALLC